MLKEKTKLKEKEAQTRRKEVWKEKEKWINAQGKKGKLKGTTGGSKERIKKVNRERIGKK